MRPLDAAPIAWVLNLDAEDELAGRGAHTPSRAMITRVDALRPRLAPLLCDGDVVVWPPGAALEDPRGFTGRAWCPTRWALDTLARAGVPRPRAPSMDVLRRVNHRRFSHELGEHLRGATFVSNAAELERHLADRALLEATSRARRWLLKRPFGFAGRGRRAIDPANLDATDRGWIDATLRLGDGVQLEPLVERTLDLGLHGWLDEDGTCTLGQVTIQHTDATGAWQETHIATELFPDERNRLEQEARMAAEALHAAGYFGPFGLDAFRWRAPDGDHHLQPRCEINARYSMGWAIGMGTP
jgi:hypothetical protein